MNQSLLPLEPISLEDNPLTKIRLIEQVRSGRDWLGSVVATSPEDMEKLQSLKHELDKGAYSTYLDKDMLGHDVLRIHHIGLDTDISEGFSELGLLGGLRHAVDKAIHPVKQVSKATGHLVKYTAEEPARLLAGIYLVGDLIYANAGRDWKTPKEILINMSGVLATMQSLIFMTYARDASEFDINALDKRIHQAIAEGKDPLDDSIWQIPDPQQANIFDKTQSLLKRYPIEIGSRLQILGQLCLATSGIMNMREGKTEAWGDVARSISSIAAWSMLQMDSVEIEEKTAWKTNPLKRMFEEVKSAPEKYASSICTLASVFGLYSSHAKAHQRELNAESATSLLELHQIQPDSKEYRQLLQDAEKNPDVALNKAALAVKEYEDGKGTPMQALAEITYLMGDATMFFAEKSHYGDSSGNYEGAAKAAAHFIQHSPMIFSESRETAFVQQLSTYLAQSRAAEAAILAKNEESKAMQQEAVDDMSRDIAKAIFAELSGKDRKIEKLANTVARMSELFPAEMRPALNDAIAETLIQTTGVIAGKEEMLTLIQRQHERFAYNTETPASPPSMSVVADLLAEITFLLPPAHNIYNASRLYDTVSGFTRQTPMQEKLVENALYQKAANDLGIPYHELMTQLRQANLTMQQLR